jgi:cellulose biosynthesis protein BcsQ
MVYLDSRFAVRSEEEEAELWLYFEDEAKERRRKARKAMRERKKFRMYDDEDDDDDDDDAQCKTESDEEELPRASDQLPQVIRSRVTGPASRAARRYPQPRAGEARDHCDKQVDSSCFKRGNELPVLEVAQGFLSKEPYNVKNIYQLLNPVFGNRVDRFGPPERVFAVSNALPGLYLIPGDPQIATFESKIAFRRAQPDVAVAQLGAFRKLLLDTAEALDIDVVLVDFGPSASALMKIMLLSCDFVLPPVFTDYFSLSSMDGLLTRVLPDMIQEHRAILQDQDFVKSTNDDVRQQLRMGFGFSRNLPRLLPFTVTNFNTSHKSVTANASVFIASMHQLIKSDAALENKVPRVPEAVRQLYTREKHLMVVAVCKKLGQLQDIAHKSGYPPVAHTQELLADWGQSTKHWMKNPYINQVLYAREKYSQYCKFILDQCFALPHRSLSDNEA